MNSGRAPGRQLTSSSVRTRLITADDSFTAGEISALTKCSGTLTWILVSAEMRWKSTCSTMAL